MELQFVEDNEIPKNNGRWTIHPLDAEIREKLIANPGKWAIYPWEKRYPNRKFNTAYSGVTSMCKARVSGAYRRTEKGKFVTRMSGKEQRVYIRYVEDNNVEQ